MVARTDLTSIDLSILSDIIKGKMNLKNHKLRDNNWYKSKPAQINQHERDWQSVWPNGYHSYEDNDGDGLDDEWEIANCDIAKNHCKGVHNTELHWEDFRSWSEDRAKEAESKYPDESKFKDWAYPGTNY